ncbi:hypothetical protein MNBD_GAMMA26-1128 [hydrothermal vent metagenome]|uniref:GGDEF domain-containing protein n=1 Tax=hydrothermal vent metagenome TaxID=652676 RepID=A0A3B1BE26_9ZZZZ
MVDLDYFKEINDQYGHLAGDTVLRYIADYLVNNLRPYDLICRFGGEEYLICLPNASLGVAHKAIDRIRGKIADMKISVSKDTEITVTASFGISILSGDEDWSLAIEHADAAMYQAKSQGRNQVVVWKETTN